MRYDEIFEKDISEYSDEEIINKALSLRSNAKLTKKRGGGVSKTSTHLTKKKPAKDAVNSTLEQLMTQAKKRQEGQTDDE